MKIILLDLDQLLFPEFYPFFNDHFKAEREYLAGYFCDSDDNLLHIKFIRRVLRFDSNPIVPFAMFFVQTG